MRIKKKAHFCYIFQDCMLGKYLCSSYQERNVALMHAGLHSLVPFYGHFLVGEHFLFGSYWFQELKKQLLSDLIADQPSQWE